MKKVKKKYNNFSIGLLIGISLLTIIGLFLVYNTSLNNNSYFAKIRITPKKKVQIVYNYNLFINNNSAIKEYNNDNQTITLDGKLDSQTIELGILNNIKTQKDDRYRVTINYLSGSYEKTSTPKFVFEFKKNGNYYSDRKNGTHYIFDALPTKGELFDRVISIKNDTKDANSISFRIYQENEVTFNNYKIQIIVTKIESKIGVAGEKYGKLSTPEKYGYKFLGWYDSISGGKKVTETSAVLKKYNHNIYAHWQKQTSSEDVIKNDYGLGNWVYYPYNSDELRKYYSGNLELLSFAEYVPEKTKSSGDSLPIIIWLHGLGEVGVTEDVFKDRGLLKVISEWNTTGLKNIPAIIIAPHLKKGMKSWTEYEEPTDTIRSLVAYAKAKYNANTNKVVLIGHSLGGSGVEGLNSKNKDLFSALVVMSGYWSDPGNNKDYFSKMPMKGYTEVHDNAEPPIQTGQLMKNFFSKIGHSSDLTVFKDGTSHGQVPKKALLKDENKDGVSDLIIWALSQNK